MDDRDVLDLETRRRIFARIVEEPGAFLRELQRRLAMPMGALEYHLKALEDARLVSVVQGENKRFFPSEMAREDRRHLVVLRQAACRRIVLHLLANPGATHAQVSDATGLLPSTASYHLAKLADGGLAVREREGRQIRTRLVDPERSYALLVRYRPTFVDEVLDRFLDSFEPFRLGRA